jgi:predicted nucleic acid-binding protein
VLEWIAQPGHAAVTSTLTVTEILVKPYRTAAEEDVRNAYDLLLSYPNLEWLVPDLETADLAARLRAKYKLETPDDIQAATAILSGATLFVTNDASFERIPAFKTLLLDRLL